jgi:dTMP kinase
VLAHAEPDRYLVLDATAPLDQITRRVKDKIQEILPDPVPRTAEAATGSFPVVLGHSPEPR